MRNQSTRRPLRQQPPTRFQCTPPASNPRLPATWPAKQDRQWRRKTACSNSPEIKVSPPKLRSMPIGKLEFYPLQPQMDTIGLRQPHDERNPRSKGHDPADPIRFYQGRHQQAQILHLPPKQSKPLATKEYKKLTREAEVLSCLCRKPAPSPRAADAPHESAPLHHRNKPSSAESLRCLARYNIAVLPSCRDTSSRPAPPRCQDTCTGLAPPQYRPSEDPAVPTPQHGDLQEGRQERSARAHGRRKCTCSSAPKVTNSEKGTQPCLTTKRRQQRVLTWSHSRHNAREDRKNCQPAAKEKLATRHNSGQRRRRDFEPANPKRCSRLTTHRKTVQRARSSLAALCEQLLQRRHQWLRKETVTEASCPE